MFKFNPETLKSKYVGLSHISKATINPKITIVDSEGKSVRLDVPSAVARKLRQSLGGVTKFTKPYPVCVATVGERVVAVESADLNQLDEYRAGGDWFSNTDRNISAVMANSQNMMFDGQMVYTFVAPPQPLATDTQIGYRRVLAYNLYHLSHRETLAPKQYATLAFKDSVSNDWTITAPVVMAAGDSIELFGDEDSRTRDHSVVIVEGGVEEDVMHRLDTYYFPNLRFTNYAARLLADQFHYDVIEPLALPQLIIEHRTFNLRAIPAPLQTSSRSPLTITNAIAWLIGLHRMVKTLDDQIVLKSCLKMLLSKGHTGVMHVSKDKNENATGRQAFIRRMKREKECVPLLSFEGLNVDKIDD